MQKMTEAERDIRINTVEQALLAERFHLKVHFENHAKMQAFEMVPAKGGVKIKPAAPVDEQTAGTAATKGNMSPGSMGGGRSGWTGRRKPRSRGDR